MGKRSEGRTAFSDLLFPCLFFFFGGEIRSEAEGSGEKIGYGDCFRIFYIDKIFIS